ncbi:MAG: hypothetical protein Q9217_004107 [Psora testacea]
MGSHHSKEKGSHNGGHKRSILANWRNILKVKGKKHLHKRKHTTRHVEWFYVRPHDTKKHGRREMRGTTTFGQVRKEQRLRHQARKRGQRGGSTGGTRGGSRGGSTGGTRGGSRGGNRGGRRGGGKEKEKEKEGEKDGEGDGEEEEEQEQEEEEKQEEEKEIGGDSGDEGGRGDEDSSAGRNNSISPVGPVGAE